MEWSEAGNDDRVRRRIEVYTKKDDEDWTVKLFSS